MTKHEYRDLLISTSAAGGFPSVDGESCRYRSATGARCPVSLLIPPERCGPSLEGLGANHPYVQEALEGCVPEGGTTECLLAVQELHDSMAKSGPWDHNKFTSGVHEILD